MKSQKTFLLNTLKPALLVFIFLISFFITSFAQTVYVTRTGSKYHNGNCGYLSRSKRPIELVDALSQGYTACSRCRPPKTVTKEKPNIISSDTSKKSNTNETTIKTKDLNESKQCEAITKKGTRCKRKAQYGSNYCWQHP